MQLTPVVSYDPAAKGCDSSPSRPIGALTLHLRVKCRRRARTFADASLRPGQAARVCGRPGVLAARRRASLFELKRGGADRAAAPHPPREPTLSRVLQKTQPSRLPTDRPLGRLVQAAAGARRGPAGSATDAEASRGRNGAKKAPPQRESPELHQVGEEEQDHHHREADPQDAARGRRDATLHGVLLSRSRGDLRLA